MNTIIITLLTITLLIMLSVIFFICLGNASYFVKPYLDVLESKQERKALVKLSLLLGILLLLCKIL